MNQNKSRRRTAGNTPSWSGRASGSGTIVAAALAVVCLSVPAAIAQNQYFTIELQEGRVASQRISADDIRSHYTQATWQAFQSRVSLASGAGGRSQGQPEPIPDPDCPPLPVQTCVDSWDVQTINPFVQTINPFPDD